MIASLVETKVLAYVQDGGDIGFLFGNPLGLECSAVLDTLGK